MKTPETVTQEINQNMLVHFGQVERELLDNLKNLTQQRDALREALTGFLKRYDQIGYSDLPPLCKARAYQILGSPDQALAALAMSEGNP